MHSRQRFNEDSSASDKIYLYIYYSHKHCANDLWSAKSVKQLLIKDTCWSPDSSVNPEAASQPAELQPSRSNQVNSVAFSGVSPRGVTLPAALHLREACACGGELAERGWLLRTCDRRAWPLGTWSLSWDWRSRRRTGRSGASPSALSNMDTSSAGNQLLPAVKESDTSKTLLFFSPSCPSSSGFEGFRLPART